MAKEVFLKRENLIIESRVGFSWTTLFFTWMVAFFRRDWGWGIFMFLFSTVSIGLSTSLFWLTIFSSGAAIFTNTSFAPSGFLMLCSAFSFWIGNIFFAFVYNREYNKMLLKNGWIPARDKDIDLLFKDGSLIQED